MQLTLSDRATPYFVDAGWSAGRSVPVAANVPTGHPAYEILAQFGQLHVGVCSDGTMLEEIHNDIAFAYGRELGARIDEWEQLLGTVLVGIGELHHRHSELYVSEDGRFFNASLIHDAIGYTGNEFEAAINNLLFGKRSMPLIRPNQKAVKWYGIEYRHGDAGLHNYRL